MTQSDSLPPRPNLEYLKKLAKHEAAAARQRSKPITLAQAQLAIARRFGFPSWRKLKSHIDLLSKKPAPTLTPFQNLMQAIVNRDNQSLTTLLAQHPEVVNQTGPHPQWGGRPQPLHVAIETNNPHAFHALLHPGANINGDNAHYGHWSPLMLALHWKRQPFRDELLRRHVHIGLTEALMLPDDRRVAHLLKNPTPDTAFFSTKTTPLHFAKTIKAARLLLAHGANPATPDAQGQTAPQAWLAAKPRSPALTRLAASLGQRPTLDILQAVNQGRLPEARQLLAQGANPNTRDPHGSQATLLHIAAWRGDLPMAKLLYAKGADPNALDLEHQTTPAHWARHALKLFQRKPCAAVAAYLEAQMKKSPPPT